MALTLCNTKDDFLIFQSIVLRVFECAYFADLTDYLRASIALFMPVAVGAGVSENVAVTMPSLQM